MLDVVFGIIPYYMAQKGGKPTAKPAAGGTKKK